MAAWPPGVWRELRGSQGLGPPPFNGGLLRRGGANSVCPAQKAGLATQPGSEKGEVLLRGVGTLRYVLILSDNSACQVPICAVAA